MILEDPDSGALQKKKNVMGHVKGQVDSSILGPTFSSDGLWNGS